VNLRHKIEQEIRERGPIPFSRYMELCLYDPEFGYYSRNAEKFGKAGDFYTSSDVHAVFGRLLARQFEEMWRALGKPEQLDVLELGPGRGLFAQDVLDWSEKKFPEFFRAVRYTLAERSASLRERLAANLRHRISSGKVVVQSQFGDSGFNNQSEDMPQPPAGGDARRSTARFVAEAPLIVFANEFFDALPVEILSEQGALRINLGDGNFVEEWAPASAAELEFLDRYGVHPETGMRTEATLVAQKQMANLSAAIEEGFLVTIDYGYTREEQLAGRHLGTVMTYRQHSASPNPYEAPGDQDITAHVNFTALASTAEQSGMRAHQLLTQSQFLLGIGEANQFGDAFEECRLPEERAKIALQLKHLVTPADMGETFQVLVASKDVPFESVENLSGLSFAKS